MPRQFTKSRDALRYIASILKRRDDYVRADMKARRAEMRKRIKTAKRASA